MEEGLGSRPSAIWRSILKARPFFERGLRTRIGNGYSTQIWRSAWPDDGNFKIITPEPASFYPHKVMDLIYPITGTWDKEYIDTSFWEIDRARILSVPLGTTSAEDKLMWHYSKDGCFSVRSCYQFLLQLHFLLGVAGKGYD